MARATILAATFIAAFGSEVLSTAVSGAAEASPDEAAPAARPFDLRRVQGGDLFNGSRAARQALEEQGFVVTGEQHKQIFAAYLSGGAPGRSLPRFITTDSAWHTYHVLLEEGVRQLEERQAALLTEFSARLYRQARVRIGKAGDEDRATEVYQDLALFAAVGWALQRPAALENLEASERPAVAKTVSRLRQRGPPKHVLFFGLRAMPERYAAISLYTRSPWLSNYFAARQWYATNVFRLVSNRETERAIQLALLVRADKTLAELHRQLHAPYDGLLGPANDSTVRQYADTAAAAFGKDVSPAAVAAQLDDFRAAAADLPAPQVNDQYLAPTEYAQFAELTKGFRLLPPRTVPSAVLFHRTVDPAVKGRMFPSGVDVFATGPLAGDAGRAALIKAEKDPAVVEAVLAAEPSSIPDSLHGHALELLTLLQQPLPAAAPPPLRTKAWGDKQLWTQLGGWAEQRHTWALHTKLTIEYLGLTSEPPGYVSPYPEFFRKLGQLARDTAPALRFTENRRSRAARAGRLVIESAAAARRIEDNPDQITAEDMSDANRLDALRYQDGFMDELFAQNKKERDTKTGMLSDISVSDMFERLGRRWIVGDGLTERDRQDVDRMLAGEIDAAELLDPFAELCDRLAEIAQKELVGKPLDQKDAQFIRDYGKTLARFHFYHGNSYLTPRDDFPLVTPVFSSPLGNRNEMLYAGLGRPETVYVVIQSEGKPVLHRGAVLSYREFRQPIQRPLDDDRWTEQVVRGDAPAPPEFTASFRHAMSERELIESIGAGRYPRQIVFSRSPAVTSALLDSLIARNSKADYWVLRHVFANATDDHVGQLLVFFEKHSASDRNLRYRARQIAGCLERLDYSPHREKLFELLHHEAIEMADAAAYLLGRQPEKLDPAALTARFDKSEPRARRLVCFLVGQLEKPDDTAAALLWKAMSDTSADIRYQAIVAVLNWPQRGMDLDQFSPRLTKRLVSAIHDQDMRVAGAATRLIVLLDLKGAAPQLFNLLTEDLRVRWKPDRRRDPLARGLLALGSESFPRPPGEVETLGGDRNRSPFRMEKPGRDKLPLRDLPAELLSAFVAFRHQPAVPELKKMLRAVEDMDQLPEQDRFVAGFAAESLDALIALQPHRKAALLKEVVADRTAARAARRRGLDHIAKSKDPALAASLLPLLTVTERVEDEEEDGPFCCDVASAVADFIVKAGDNRDDLADFREESVRRLTGLLRTKAGPEAVEALSRIYDKDVLKRMTDFALDQELPVNTRAEAIRRFGRAAMRHQGGVWGLPDADQTDPFPDTAAAEHRVSERVAPQIKRLAALLDDKSPLEDPEDEGVRLCDVAASELAEVLFLKDRSPDGFDRSAHDKFVDYVRKAVAEYKEP